VSESSRYMGCACIHCTSAAAAAEGTDSGYIAVSSLAVALPADDGCSSYRLGRRGCLQMFRVTRQDRVRLQVENSRYRLVLSRREVVESYA
jgi:hypothetical protein